LASILGTGGTENNSQVLNAGITVPEINQATIRNRLLTAMSAADFALLAPHLTEVELKSGETLIAPETPITHSWFLEDGICSVVASTPSGHQTEVGLIGRDGIVDISAIHGADRTPLLCFIQISGQGLRLRADALRRADAASPSLHRLLMRYAQSFFVQVAHTALTNASHTIAQRLARWLLMSHDRIEASEVRLTHERLSLMLGVRRAGVTVAIQTLERAGIIAARRGSIAITDRARLETYAADSYGAPEKEYHRLLGVSIRD
jgi:CRP-like cAMP-binding protein